LRDAWYRSLEQEPVCSDRIRLDWSRPASAAYCGARGSPGESITVNNSGDIVKRRIVNGALCQNPRRLDLTVEYFAQMIDPDNN